MVLASDIIQFAQTNAALITQERAERIVHLAPGMREDEREKLQESLTRLVEAKKKLAEMDHAATEKHEKQAAQKAEREAQEKADRETELADAETLIDSLI